MNIDKKRFKCLRALDEGFQAPIDAGSWLGKWLMDTVAPDGLDPTRHIDMINSLMVRCRKAMRDNLSIISKPMIEMANENHDRMIDAVNATFLKDQIGAVLIDGQLYCYYIQKPNFIDGYEDTEIYEKEDCRGMAIILHFNEKAELVDADFCAVRRDYECDNRHKIMHDHYSGLMPITEDAKYMFIVDFQCFIALMAFLQYADTETVIVNNGQKKTTPSGGEMLVNSIGYPVKYIDSRWVREIIRTEGFKVRGHFRLQPCGEGRADKKLIYIHEYQKNGYHRRSGKDMSNK